MISVMAVNFSGMVVAITGNGVFRAMERGDSGKGKRRKKCQKKEEEKNSGLERRIKGSPPVVRTGLPPRKEVIWLRDRSSRIMYRSLVSLGGVVTRKSKN